MGVILMSDVFNMSGLFSLKSESKGETMSFGAYNGSRTISIFRSNGQKGSNLPVNGELYVLLCDIISDAAKGGPNAAFPIRRFKFDVQTKKRVLDLVITVGKDSNGIFYIEFKDIDNAPIKFPFIGSKYLESGADGDSDRSFRAFKAFQIFVTREWINSAHLTRNNLQQRGGNRNNNNNNSSNNNYSNNNSNSGYSGSNMSSEDDIY